MKEHIVKGIIYTRDSLNLEYAVCYIEQISYENDHYKYIFRPFYSIIDLCNASFFQGIPGLKLELRKYEYIRQNKTPTFIYERTPQENREDLWHLLDEVEMNYLDKLEWLIKTDKRYTGDNLFVKRYEKPRFKSITTNLTYQDKIEIEDLDDLSETTYGKIKAILDIIISGANLYTKNFVIDDKNRKNIYHVFYNMYKNHFLKRKQTQEQGIEKGKKEARYKGRKRIEVSVPKLEEVIENLDQKEITIEKAMKLLGLKSRSTFYRRVKEYRELKSNLSRN